MLRSMIGDARWERLPARWRDERRGEGRAMAAENAGLGPPDPPFDVARLSMPVVVGWGGATGGRARRAAEELAAALPTAVAHVVPDAVHEAPVRDPAGYATFVTATLRRAQQPAQ
jgi:pimeloyl-ACP methyl ester carboxylesterase